MKRQCQPPLDENKRSLSHVALPGVRATVGLWFGSPEVHRLSGSRTAALYSGHDHDAGGL